MFFLVKAHCGLVCTCGLAFVGAQLSEMEAELSAAHAAATDAALNGAFDSQPASPAGKAADAAAALAAELAAAKDATAKVCFTGALSTCVARVFIYFY